MEEEVGELISCVKAEGIDDCPRLVPCDDVTKPIDPCTQQMAAAVKSSLAGLGVKTTFGDEPALPPEQQQGDIDDATTRASNQRGRRSTRVI